MRLGTTILLSTALGVEAFGSYTFAITVATMISVFSPLGLDIGAVFFGAQYHNQDRAKQRAMIINGYIVTGISGVVFAGGLWWGADLFGDPAIIRRIAPVILFLNPLLFSVGVIRSIKDMRGNAIVYQITPSILLLCMGAATYFFSLSLSVVLLMYTIAMGISAGLGIFWVGKATDVLFDRSLPNRYSLFEQLQYSIPQSLAAMAFRLTIWTDIIMLGFLSTERDLGLYRIAAALAMMGALPVSALSTIFNPIIAKKVSEKAWAELNATLKTVTRWLMSLSLPVLCAMFLLPDFLLQFFGEEYIESQTSLLILIGGQFVWVSCAMAMRLIPMSGRSTLNLINGICAALLNILLNWYLIPKYGTIGAAISTSITLGLWSLWRLLEIWHLMNCFPFTKSSFLFFGLACGIALVGYPFLIPLSLWIRFPLVFIISCLFLYFTIQIGTEDADVEIMDILKSKIPSFFRRRRSS